MPLVQSKALQAHLKQDQRDESKAIKGYGLRKHEAKGTGLSSMLTEIQNDEKDHHAKLTKALQGLKSASPKDDY